MCLLCSFKKRLSTSLYTAISRKVVENFVHATTPKGNMGYDQYTVPNDCSCRTYFDCFPLALANICPWPLVPFFQICLENRADKTTHNTFRDCRVHFSTIFLKTAVYGGRQLLVWRKTVMHINEREDSGRHQRGLILSFYDHCSFSKKFARHNSMQKKEVKVGHKLLIKKKGKGKKESAREGSK